MQPLVEELRPAPDPVACCERAAAMPYRVFLDSAADPARLGRHSFLCADPAILVRARGARTECTDLRDGRALPVAGHALETVRALMAPWGAAPVPGLPPFQGGAAGYIGYDWGRVLERLPSPRHDDVPVPDVMLGIYDWVVAWDHATGRAWLISTGVPEEGSARRRRAEERLALVRRVLAGVEAGAAAGAAPARGAPPERQDATAPAFSRHPVPTAAWPPNAASVTAPSFPVTGVPGAESVGLRSSFTHEGYLEAVSRVREYILAGDIFQANLSQRLEAPLREEPWALYRRLRAINPAPFAAFLDLGDAAVVSASPERFLRVIGRQVEARPIKGTRPRGIGPEHDAALGRALSESEKDRAENLMIVDLLRNDLSRVCTPGTVRVPELFALERYSTVHHLVSTVVGELAPERDAVDLLCAAFPGGSITGAPKVRAMEIIAELEPSRRGVYCGSVGYLSLTGALDTSIVIRTYLALAGAGGPPRVYFSVGGGIVADSDPEDEYRETLAKGRALIEALALRAGEAESLRRSEASGAT
ncbi:MAG TPA: aminodeoxychorismate synthase component I [Gemmatimonadaceae bacterium]|nr:aminodeoxychorismate synthase component I [Gemmatimonadaceae bacterium]